MMSPVAPRGWTARPSLPRTSTRTTTPVPTGRIGGRLEAPSLNLFLHALLEQTVRVLVSSRRDVRHFIIIRPRLRPTVQGPFFNLNPKLHRHGPQVTDSIANHGLTQL